MLNKRHKWANTRRIERKRWSGVERSSMGALHKNMSWHFACFSTTLSSHQFRCDTLIVLCTCVSLFPSVRIRMPLFHFDFLRRWIEHPNSHNSNNNNHNFSFIIPLQSCRKISRYKFVSTESLLVTTMTTTATTTTTRTAAVAAVASEAPAEVIAAPAIRATVTQLKRERRMRIFAP